VHVVVVKMFSDLGEMFLVILGSIASASLIWFLVKKDTEPLLGVYAQPGITGSRAILCYACILSYFFFLRASAMLKHVIDIGWTSVCLSVRLSHAGTVSKRLNVLS